MIVFYSIMVLFFFNIALFLKIFSVTIFNQISVFNSFFPNRQGLIQKNCFFPELSFPESIDFSAGQHCFRDNQRCRVPKICFSELISLGVSVDSDN